MFALHNSYAEILTSCDGVGGRALEVAGRGAESLTVIGALQEGKPACSVSSLSLLLPTI